MKNQSDKAFDLWLASQLPVGRALPVHIYFSLEERRMAKNGFDAGKELQATRITELEAQLADAKQAARWESDLASQAIADLEPYRKDAERYRWLREQDDSAEVFCVRGKSGTWGECGHSNVYETHLDETIDAAIQAEGKQA